VSGPVLQSNLEIRVKSLFYGLLILVLFALALSNSYFLLENRIVALFPHPRVSPRLVAPLYLLVAVVLGLSASWLLYTSTLVAEETALINRLQGYLKVVLLVLGIMLFLLSCSMLYLPLLLREFASLGEESRQIFNKAVRSEPELAYFYLGLLKVITYLFVLLLPFFMLLVPPALKLLLCPRRTAGHIPPPVAKYNSLVTLLLLLFGLLLTVSISSVLWSNFRFFLQDLYGLQSLRDPAANRVIGISFLLIMLTVLLAVQSVKGQYSYIASAWSSLLYRYTGILSLVTVVAVIYAGFLLRNVTTTMTDADTKVIATGAEQINLEVYDVYVLHVVYIGLSLCVMGLPLFLSRLRILYLKWSNVQKIYNLHG